MDKSKQIFKIRHVEIDELPRTFVTNSERIGCNYNLGKKHTSCRNNLRVDCAVYFEQKTCEIESVKTFQSLFKQKFHREHQNKYQRNFHLLRKICLGIITTTLGIMLIFGIRIDFLISGLEFQLLSRLKGIALTVTKTSLPIQRKDLGRIKEP